MKLHRQELLEKAAEHEELALMWRCMRTWQAAVKKQRERLFVVLTCVVKLDALADKCVQEVVFGAWKLLREPLRDKKRELVSWALVSSCRWMPERSVPILGARYFTSALASRFSNVGSAWSAMP